jgi:hypothetical protein
MNKALIIIDLKEKSNKKERRKGMGFAHKSND